jgi:hypothetical protein
VCNEISLVRFALYFYDFLQLNPTYTEADTSLDPRRATQSSQYTDINKYTSSDKYTAPNEYTPPNRNNNASTDLHIDSNSDWFR